MTTLNLQVGASTDDACEGGGGGMVLTNDNVYLLSSSDWGGFRFTNVTIPNSATIDSATLQVYVSDTDYDDIELDIYGEDADNPGTFLSSGYNISGRSRTSASVNKSATGVGVGWYSMPDVKTIIQEIIDEAWWDSGDALVLIEDGLTGVNLYQRAWDHTSSQAAKLDIDYTAGQPMQLRGTTVRGLRHWQPGRI